MREYDFKDEETGREVKGMSIYYVNELSTRDGLAAKGYTTEKVTVKANTELYKRMLNADYEKPFEVEMSFDILPGFSRPALLDIKL